MTVVAKDPISYRDPIQRLAATEHAFAVTPSDTDELAYVVSRLYIGVAGNVALVTYKLESVTYAVQAGTYLDLRVRQVKLTGTTATGIIGEY